MREALSVRDATAADIPFLVDSNRAMALETEQKTLDRDLLERGVAALFEHPSRGFYLVAECGAGRAGCLLVTYEWSDWRSGMWWWLQSVYVVPAARRGGVFSALHAEVERRSREAGNVLGLRLYVERDNAGAHEVYERLGLRLTHYQLREREYPCPGSAT
jgi:GNAT superfamily N-acetyltransferase